MPNRMRRSAPRGDLSYGVGAARQRAIPIASNFPTPSAPAADKRMDIGPSEFMNSDPSLAENMSPGYPDKMRPRKRADDRMDIGPSEFMNSDSSLAENTPRKPRRAPRRRARQPQFGAARSSGF